MLALLLFYFVDWRVALGELFTELILGLIFLGPGGGLRKFKKTLDLFVDSLRKREHALG